MKASFLREADFKPWLAELMTTQRVVGPVARRSQFVFADLESADDVRLDYPCTILPPKKVFFPPVQDLVRFDGNKFEGCIKPVPTVLFGVHFYDVKAIDQTDLLFRERNADYNYLAQREATTIVASNIQQISQRAFWDSVGSEVEPKGHDAFLTKVDGGYLLETRTPRGEALLKQGSFRDASAAELDLARKVNQAVMGKCPEKLKASSKDIAWKVRAAFAKEDLWKGLAVDCFSCGSCNTVCPTCYCFDVQDHWNVDQKSGARVRTWDSCLTSEFAQITARSGRQHIWASHISSAFGPISSTRSHPASSKSAFTPWANRTGRRI